MFATSGALLVRRAPLAWVPSCHFDREGLKAPLVTLSGAAKALPRRAVKWVSPCHFDRGKEQQRLTEWRNLARKRIGKQTLLPCSERLTVLYKIPPLASLGRDDKDASFQRSFVASLLRMTGGAFIFPCAPLPSSRAIFSQGGRQGQGGRQRRRRITRRGGKTRKIIEKKRPPLHAAGGALYGMVHTVIVRNFHVKRSARNAS